MQPFITYDPEADALYVYLQSGGQYVAETRELDTERYVDYDERDEVIGIEFLDVSRGIDLAGVPEAARVAEAIRSFPQLTPA